MAKDIRVRGSFGSQGIHDGFVLAALEGVAVLDLTNARFVTPAGLVTLAAYAHRARDKGRSVHLSRPQSEDVANYVSRAHLGQVLVDMGATHDLPSVREHAVGVNLLPITEFKGPRDAAQLAEHVRYLVERDNELAADALAMSISALGENVAEHSHQPRGYAAAQLTHGGTVFRFAVADAGRGFRRALRRHSPRDDAHALGLALEPGVSGLADGSRGYGLSELRAIVESLGGTLRMWSGRGSLTAWPRGSRRTASYEMRLPVSVLEGQFDVRNRRR